MTRTWAEHDRVAEHRGGRWRLGVVASVDTWTVAIRWDGAEHLSFRSPSSADLIDPDEVPIDDRHWLPASVRDQLVRQEAAGRLRAMAAHLPYGAGLDALADRIDVGGATAFDPWRVTAARALLAPTPQPATTPTTEGLPA